MYFIYSGGSLLNIIISNTGGKPIYDQIASQIKNQIITGELKPGEPLPSMRLLAKELRISVITTKRAYNDLEEEGFLETIPGKGSFVALRDASLVREEILRRVEGHLGEAVEIARKHGISREELSEILQVLYE